MTIPYRILIMSSSVNLYDVLDISQDASLKDIKAAYRKLVKEFHPDTGGDAEMFELITRAYTVLSNKKSREEYDTITQLSEQSHKVHLSRKSGFDDFIKAQEVDVKKRPKGEAEKDFQRAMSDMDKKRGYRRGEMDGGLDAKTTNLKYEDLMRIREQEDIENTHDQLFDGPVDAAQLNALWDKTYGGPMALIPHSGKPEAFNAISGDIGTSFSTLDRYDDLYDDGDDETMGNSMFSSIKQSDTIKKVTRKDIEGLKKATYTDEHNQIDDDYEKMVADRLRERELDTKKFDERVPDDFDADDDCGGYGIFKPLGLKNSSNISWNDDGNDISAAYNRLLENRRKID